MDIILCSILDGNRWRLFGCVVDNREEDNCIGITWWHYPLCIGIIPTLQPANFGRVYAAYGGIFILSSIIWGRVVDKKRPDKYEIIGSFVAVFGAIIIFYSPR
jgi:drug/metabolite transporter superfamily protein YnfA